MPILRSRVRQFMPFNFRKSGTSAIILAFRLRETCEIDDTKEEGDERVPLAQASSPVWGRGL